MFTGFGLGCLHGDENGNIRLHGDMSGDGAFFTSGAYIGTFWDT